MEREIIFEKQSISGFQFFEMYGMYAKSIIPAPFALTVGESYIVAWDDDEYPVTAVDISALFPGGIAVGNGSGFGLPGNNEPFIVAVFETDITLFVLDPTDTRDTHSFGAYKEIEEETPVNIILRNPMGEEEEYPMRPMIELDTTDGNTALYSKGEVLDSITIEPDFATGDMTVSAPDGYLVKSAVIAKPASLVPENIPVGINIAGVDGAREEAGGGSTDCVEWLQVAQYATRKQATTVTGTIKCTIPKDCLEWAVLKMYQTFSGSSSITISSATAPTVEFGEVGLTVTEDETHITVSYTKTWSSSVSSVKYKYMLMQLVIAFVMGNMYIDSSSGSNVLIGKPALKYLPIVDTIYGKINCTKALGKIDFSQTMIEKYEWLTAPNDSTLKEIRLPASCTTIGQYACSSCNMLTKISSLDVDVVVDYQINLPNVKKIETFAFRSAKFKTAVLPSIEEIGANAFYLCSSLTSIDMSGVSAVPTLGGSGAIPTNSGLQILVPSALYGEWIAATNWSTLADYIVAV